MSHPGSDERLLIAFDFGGTKLAVALVNAESLAIRRMKTVAATADGPSNLASALDLADTLLEDERVVASAVGVSFGGHVEGDTGVVRRSVHVPGWDGLPLGRILGDHFRTPVIVRNDGTAGACGEWRSGAGKGMSNIVYLTVSTGVGGGLIIASQPYEGGSGLAAEFGHLPVPGARRNCACGGIGCLETVAAGPAIALSAEMRIAAGEVTSMNSGAITGAYVAARASQGDALAKDILEEAGRAVGYVASTISASVDPEAIIIGGGVSQSGQSFWSGINSAMRPPFSDERQVLVVAAKHRTDAPIYGAAYLAAAL